MPTSAQSDSVPRDAGGRGGPLFVGRDRELHELQNGVRNAIAGRGRLFLLTGEPGIGRTRLASAVADAAPSAVQMFYLRRLQGRLAEVETATKNLASRFSARPIGRPMERRSHHCRLSVARKSTARSSNPLAGR